MELIYSDDILTANVDKEKSLLQVVWHRHPDGQEFKDRFKILVDVAIAQEYTYWLSDSRAIHYLDISVQNWVIDQVLPLLKNRQLKKFARITTKESLTLMDMSRLHKVVDAMAKHKELAELEFFLSYEDAMEWLLEEYPV